MIAKFVLSCGLVAVTWLQAVGQPAPEITAQHKKLLELTNAERKKMDLPPLKVSPLLHRVASAHSQNMAKQGKLDHVLDGKNPIDRLREAGYKFSALGENVARMNGSDSMETLMKQWMDSKIHHDNILNPEVTEIGLGMASDSKGQVFYTQVFGKPR